jgi:hypothetical protein
MPRLMRLLLTFALIVSTLLALGASVQASDTSGQLDPAMVALWNRTDAAVAAGTANRSWMWGPQANYIVQEPYTYAPLADDGNQRLVAYFDKSRMEINNPAGDSDAVWYVSNGRLAWEMMTGKVQIGQDPDQFQYGLPAAYIPVAGDPYSYNTPSYATMGKLMFSAPDRTAQEVIATVDYNGTVGADLTPAAEVRNALYVTYPGADGPVGHNIPTVFWDFLTLGISPVVQPADWLFVTGYPQTEAYWTHADINANPTDVLVQCFERRCLTYTPSNNDPYKVEMGNVGQHYYTWRYGGGGALCYVQALRGIGQLWQEQDLLRAKIGCPNYFVKDDISTAYEPFEHGMMLWLNVPDEYSPVQSVLVLFDDGTYAAYQDTWVDGDPIDDPSLTPPTGLYQPGRGFGKIWREAPSVRDRLGWATAPESGADGDLQGFDAGYMVQIGALDQIYVFYGNFAWTATGAWEVYADPYDD